MPFPPEQTALRPNSAAKENDPSVQPGREVKRGEVIGQTLRKVEWRLRRPRAPVKPDAWLPLEFLVFR